MLRKQFSICEFVMPGAAEEVAPLEFFLTIDYRGCTPKPLPEYKPATSPPFMLVL